MYTCMHHMNGANLEQASSKANRDNRDVATRTRTKANPHAIIPNALRLRQMNRPPGDSDFHSSSAETISVRNSKF